MKIDVVIGANYGDEGKGLVTEWLCMKHEGTAVALLNGGCQRGHTVTDRTFGRHVFHHFGSGTFRGAPTCFCKGFLLNPMQFVKEYCELESMGARPVPLREERCGFQLPVDIYVNRLVEKSRGEKRHGSVGCGIWETARRLCSGEWPTFSEFSKLGRAAKLDFVKESQRRILERRLAEDGLEPDEHAETFLSDGMAEHFVQDCEFTAEACREVESVLKLRGIDRVVFEQGQGLALDQAYGEDPVHTTPSYTGLIDVANRLAAVGWNEGVAADYVTRTYATRHGAGPFPEEDSSVSFSDETNMPNEWQGTMRFGLLDADILAKRVDRDLMELYATLARRAEPCLFVTHINELPRPLFRPRQFSAVYESASVYADEMRRVV